MEILSLLAALVGGGVGFGAGWGIFKPKAEAIESTARDQAERVRKTAQKEADSILKDARDQAERTRRDARREEEQVRKRLDKTQSEFDARLSKREEVLENKIDKADAAKAKYEEKKEDTEAKQAELQEKIDAQDTVIEELSGLTKDQAKAELISRVEAKAEQELADTLKRKVELMRTDAEREGTNILVQAIQRFASPVTNDATTSVVKLPSDDIKGRIIGREGRNINAFERVTGVDLIIDDAPGTVTISSYDMFRRYVAKVALEQLIKDGRIQPASIEKAVEEAEANAEKLILEIGQAAADELSVSFPEPILKLVGRLRFRTSYGQNVLKHSKEVAWLAEAIAEQIPGADPLICKRSGLVHDIGKAVSHEVEGGHAVIGKEILEKFGIDEPVITAMKSHHEDFPYESIEARILQAADAISASRPGARRETLEKYIKRLKQLETIASNFDGVKKAFAIQAGREVRVFVNANKIDDFKSEKLSFEMARKIEKECEYPGEVRVVVIREKRYKQVAR